MRSVILLKGEDLFQSQVCKILDFVKLPYFSIPNGSYKSRTARLKFLATGLKSGVPDLFIPRSYMINNETIRSLRIYHGCFIELKNGKDGRVSDDQKEWIKKLSDEGYGTYVVRFMPELYKVIHTCYPHEAARIRGIEKMY